MSEQDIVKTTSSGIAGLDICGKIPRLADSVRSRRVALTRVSYLTDHRKYIDFWQLLMLYSNH